MTWAPQQEQAIKAVRAWLADRRGPQVFRLFGYAGTGKTTLAKALAEDVPGTVLYACFTGKAAMVLRSKGCDGAGTIHSLIYRVESDDETGEAEFSLNPESPLASASLLVVDEVSMVGEELARDLLSFGTKVLVLGDPAQLPPVKGEGFFINAKPDAMLTEVHRQAADNPIIRMSMDVREGRGLKPGQYGTSRVVRRADITRDEMAAIVLGADQLLCGRNLTRHAFNGRVRALKGFRDPLPQDGDRLICLRNNHKRGFLNGSIWRAVGASSSVARTVSLQAMPEDTPGGIEALDVRQEFFAGTEGELEWKERRRSDEFTYGWAITVHKSQGSQWPSVCVYDESGAFRDSRANHLYTAVTRAAEQVTVVLP